MYFIIIFHNLIEIYLDFITTRFYTTLRTTSNNIRNNLRILISPRVRFLIYYTELMNIINILEQHASVKTWKTNNDPFV